MEEFPDLAGFLEHVSLVMEADRQRRRPSASSIMTLHAAKGLEFDTVFLPGWEEGLFPQPARARRERPRRPRGGAPPRLCRHHPRAPPREDLLRLQPPHPRPVADRPFPRASSTNCPRRMSRSSRRRRQLRRLWRQRASTDGRLRLDLQHARLAARAGAATQGGGGGSRRRQVPAAASASAGSRGYDAGPGRKGPLLIEGELVAKSTGARRRFAAGAARLPHQVRQRHGRRRRRQQADDRFRQGRPEDGAGQLRPESRLSSQA